MPFAGALPMRNRISLPVATCLFAMTLLGMTNRAFAFDAYNPASFNFDGFYLGAQGGGQFGNPSSPTLGLVAGANFAVLDPVVAGLEFQGDVLPTTGNTAYDFYSLGRVGVVVTGDFMVYGEAGPGWSRGNFGYAIGAGGEYALSDVLSAKGEIQGIGNFGSSPFGTKIQGGVLFHMQ
jgi:hypothetical protein